MSEKEIMEQFAPKKCENQVEFDERIHAINHQQSVENHPYLDRLRELAKKKALIETQKQALNIQLNAIKEERLDIEQKQKDMNRLFHQLKHELIEMNPKGLKNEPDKEEEAA